MKRFFRGPVYYAPPNLRVWAAYPLEDGTPYLQPGLIYAYDRAGTAEIIWENGTHGIYGRSQYLKDYPVCP